MKTRFKELADKGIIIFDGAMGTYIATLDTRYGRNCERANIESPYLVAEIHRQYIEAGAQVIISNTFAANRLVYGENEAEKLLCAGWDIALKAAGDEAVAIASIGQINGPERIRTNEYIWTAKKLLARGARAFLFETQSSISGIKECAEYIKKVDPDAYVIAGFAVNDAGFTTEGIFARDILKEAEKVPEIDACGLNCGCSASYMLEIVSTLKVESKPLIVMPNAGSLTVVGKLPFFKGSAQFFAEKASETVKYGAAMVGGCCGTTPEHISLLVKLVNAKEDDAVKVFTFPAEEKQKGAAADDEGSRFWDKLVSGERPRAVELDPPKDADLSRFLDGVRDLKEGNADIITIADCPIGRARMDSSLLACKIHREFNMEALPHMTCRDRNLNATQALMLGLYAEGIRNMLLVTGDPVPSAEKSAIKAVYQFNSRKFAAFATALKEKMFPSEVHFFGALNVNARNFDIQLRIAQEKIQNGISGFLTQPVLTREAFENLKRAKEELGGYILGGIIPVVSEKNGKFMNSEISGINVDPEVIEMYVGKDREESEELAVSISSEIARQIAPYVDGYYFMTPFQRTGLIRRIMDSI